MLYENAKQNIEIESLVEPFMIPYDVKEGTSYPSQVFQRFPLIGDCVISDSVYEKLFSNAKKAIDINLKRREEREPLQEFPLAIHEQVALVVIQIAKHWNNYEEGKFSKYVAMQFGYRDDSGKVWSLITNSLYQAFSRNRRLFIRGEKGDREFYETIMVHSFGPARAWFPLLDLLFSFYRDNLEWRYIPNDPLFQRVVDVLQRRFNNAGLSDEEVLIASKSYLLRVGIKRLIQEAPFYCAKLFEDIIERMDQLVSGSAESTKRYCLTLVDQWFFEKVSFSVDLTARRDYGRNFSDVALDYKSISPKYVLKSDGVYLSIPSIRLSDVGNKNIEAQLYKKNNKILSFGLKVRGNELGETIQGTSIKIPYDYIRDGQLDITLRITDTNFALLGGGKTIYDSGNGLFRSFLVFTGEREIKPERLRKESYYFFTPSYKQLTGTNVDIEHYREGISKVSLHKGYTLTYAGVLISMDLLETRDLRIVNPVTKEGLTYRVKGKEFKIITSSAIMCLYFGSESLLKRYQVIVNDKVYALSYFFDKEAGNRSVIRFEGEDINAYSIKVIDLNTGGAVFQDYYYVLDSIDCRFDKEIYIATKDIGSAKASVTINGNEIKTVMMPEDQIAMADYEDGTIYIDIPSIKVEYDNTLLLADRYIYASEIQEEAHLRFTNNTGHRFEVSYGSSVINSPSVLPLSDIAESASNASSDSAEILLKVNNRVVSIGTIIYKDTFVKDPAIVYLDNKLYWDGGVSFVGSRDTDLEVVLTNNEEKRVFPLQFGETLVASFDENEFVEDYYEWAIRTANDAKYLFIKKSFFGSEEKARFFNKIIHISSVSEDIELTSKRIPIKPVSIDSIKFVGTLYVDSEEDVFDVYSGRMYWTAFNGDKRFLSFNYSDNNHNHTSKYKVNPVKIIYINKKYLRIVNDDDEGLYCHYNDASRQPGYEITDINPSINDASYYFDILYYEYSVETNNKEVIQRFYPEEIEHAAETIIIDNFDDVCAHVDDDEGELTNKISPTELITEIDDACETIDSNTKNDADTQELFTHGHTIVDPVVTTQQAVISAPVDKRLFVNAGPGTGKTWTLIEKIIYLVNVLEVDPESIQVLTFSRSATEVIRKRMQEAIFERRADLATNYVDIRTFDSYASQLLYWVKESDYDLIPQSFPIESLNYEQRIQKFIEIIKKEPDLISQCKHLIVDEVQDLVLSRAEMVLEMIDAIPADSGVTLLGDACQAIYDYQVDAYSMGAEDFFGVIENKDDFTFYSFTENHRQTTNLQAYSEVYRTPIISKDIDACNECLKTIRISIPEYDVKNIKYFEEDSLDRLIDEGNVGILTRSNAQALEIDSLLKKKNIDHAINRRLEDQYYNGWVADLFNSTEKTSFNEDDFKNEIRKYLNISDIENTDIDDIWTDISSVGNHTTGRIQNKDILSAILKAGKSKALFIKESDNPVTVSTIHRSKGREYDSVLILDDLLSQFSDNIEEQRVNYVALSRAKEHIYKITLPDKRFRKLESGRCYSWQFGAKSNKLTDFEVGRKKDFVEKSFCMNAYTQEYIRSNRRDLVGQEVYLERSNDNGVVYDIIMRKNNLWIGKTSSSFAADLKTAIRATKNLPPNAILYDYLYPKRFSGLYVMDVASEIGICIGNEKGIKEYGDMITWNTLIPYGYARAEY